MTVLATIEVGGPVELALVRITVAVLAFAVGQAVLRNLLPLNVALFARDRLVLANQRVVRVLVAIQSKGG
jgi:hypothetical protein